MSKKGVPLPVEVLWRAKLMYLEKDEMGRQKWSMREVAKYFGISETSVLRAVRGEGRFGNVDAVPLPEPAQDAEFKEMAARGLENLAPGAKTLEDIHAAIRAARDENTPGKTRADKMLEEMQGPPISDEVKKRAKEFLG